MKGLNETQRTYQRENEEGNVFSNHEHESCEEQQISNRNDRNDSSIEETDERGKIAKTKRKTRKNGAILIGSENVRRVRAAAMTELKLDSNVSFVSSPSERVTQKLSDIVTRSKAQKIDVVLHTGVDQLRGNSADFVLESIVRARSAAQSESKRLTKYLFVL